MALQAKLLSHCFSKSYSMVMLQLQTKDPCKKERGSCKLMLSLEAVTFYCKKILQLTI